MQSLPLSPAPCAPEPGAACAETPTVASDFALLIEEALARTADATATAGRVPEPVAPEISEPSEEVSAESLALALHVAPPAAAASVSPAPVPVHRTTLGIGGADRVSAAPVPQVPTRVGMPPDSITDESPMVSQVLEAPNREPELRPADSHTPRLPSICVPPTTLVAAAQASAYEPFAATPAPAPLESVAPHVSAGIGQPGWEREFVQVVVRIVREEQPRAEIRLEPPELGPIEVKLALSGGTEPVAQLHFAAPHPATREALEAALPALRAALAEAGIALGQASVGSDASGEDAPARLVRAQSGTREAAASEPTGELGAPLRTGLVDTYA